MTVCGSGRLVHIVRISLRFGSPQVNKASLFVSDLKKTDLRRERAITLSIYPSISVRLCISLWRWSGRHLRGNTPQEYVISIPNQRRFLGMDNPVEG